MTSYLYIYIYIFFLYFISFYVEKKKIDNCVIYLKCIFIFEVMV